MTFQELTRDLALSTVWAHPKAPEGAPPLASAEYVRGLLRAIDATGLRRLELEYRLTLEHLELLLPEIKARGIVVGSLHNFIPTPPGVEKGSGDAFNLASIDREELDRAVTHTMSGLELASDLEVGVMVVHLGWVEGQADKRITREAGAKGGMTPELARALERRRAGAPRALDAASRALDRLLPRAESLGVRIGLENRSHYFQIPDIEEAGLLLERFRGAPVGLWYDVGHAHTQELAGLGPAAAWLEGFADDILGCHLHDCKGTKDHLPPGRGELDWEALCPRLLPLDLKVLELAGGPAPEEVAEAAEFLALAFARAGEEIRKTKEAKA